MANSSSTHILNASSNLLGFCLIVLTSLKITKFDKVTLIDEFTGFACILLMSCSVLSFLSIRTTKQNLSIEYEKIAEIIFLLALTLIFGITFAIAFTVLF